MEKAGARPQHGARRRCSDPKGTGCKQFARRNTVPATCAKCGGGTRAETKHNSDGTKEQRGLINIPPKVAALIANPDLVAELDDEELARGYPRAEDGSFRGRPAVIPTSLHQRIQRELFARAGQTLRENLLGVAETMTSIAQNVELDPAVRVRAAQWVFERIMGKTPDVQITIDEKRYEKVLTELDRTAIEVEFEPDGREA